MFSARRAWSYGRHHFGWMDVLNGGACAADAERSGYQAIVVTVDAPFLGKREADERYG